eukprot:scaffold576_cov106-Cylindrotheca_fusiformis.AAC.2
MLRQHLLGYQKQQRCMFATSKRRRGKRRLPVTTRDRLRGLPASRPRKKEIDADLVAERVTTRLEWMRSNIEGLWKDPNTDTRPDRYELVMDGNWWRWNVLLAVSPALVIALYCELVAIPEMRKEQGKDGFVPPMPPSNSFMDNLYEGFQHYIFGVDPKGIADGAQKDLSSPQQTKEQRELQQIQELKIRIQEIETRILSGQQYSNIHKRRQAQSPSPTTEKVPKTTNAESESSILSNLLESLETLRQTLLGLMEGKDADKDEQKGESPEEHESASQETPSPTIPMDPELIVVESAVVSANSDTEAKNEKNESIYETPGRRSLWRWWPSNK